MFRTSIVILVFLQLASLVCCGGRTESPESGGEASQRPAHNRTGPAPTIQDAMLAPEGALAFEIVQRERIKKGGSLNPLRPPKYVLLVVKATLSEACSDLSESEVRATLEVNRSMECRLSSTNRGIISLVSQRLSVRQNGGPKDIALILKTLQISTTKRLMSR